MFEHCTFKNNAIIIMHTFDGVYLHVNIFCYVCYIFIHQFKKIANFEKTEWSDFCCCS